jgi:hypothetical protein
VLRLSHTGVSSAEQDPAPQVQQQPLELLLEPEVFQCKGPYVTVFLDLEDTIKGWHL